MEESKGENKGAKVPGPRRVGLIQTVRTLTDLRGVLRDMVRQYGDIFGVPTPAGFFVMTGHPEAARAIFTADPDLYDIPMVDQLAPYFGETSLILTAGARHRQDRKLLNPPFHGARMRAYGDAIVEVAEAEIKKLRVGNPFVMLDLTQAISLEVILRAIFGVEEDERRGRFREAVIRLMAAMASPIIATFESMRRDFGGLGPWARFRRAKEALDALLYDEIAARRRNTEAREDILSLMMSARYDDGGAMTDKELRDQLHLLLFAGHDTTSTALAWAFYWLHRRKDALDRALAEIDALGPRPEPDAVAAAPYLDAICQETLRIHPVAANVARLLKEPMNLLGYTVAAGSIVSVSIILLHDRGDLYPEPDEFRPERFLERKFSPFEFIPFGGGTRRCIGAAFAMYEMKLVLATLLRAYRFRLASDKPVKAVNRGITMGPKGGVRMILEGPR